MTDKINQSKSNVVGDQIAGNKTVIINYTENSNEFTDEFNNFLEKTELHSISSYRELKFNDLYIPIDLSHDNSDSIDKVNIEDLYLKFIDSPKNLIIYGNDISGKTSSLKYLINNLKNDFVTIYTDDIHNIQLPVKNFLANKKKQIYKYNFDREKTILFIDNFHKLNNDRMIKILKSAEDVQNLYFIFTVDSVFINNIKLRDLTKDFDIYKIKSMGYFLQDKLIENWLRLNNTNENILLKEKDKYMDKLDSIILKSILPRYPFFIYAILSDLNGNNNIDPNITSHGHCYQTLIYLSLYKVGVKDELMDSYYNILTELSFYFYQNYDKNKSCEIHKDELNSFFKNNYEYNMQESIEKILDKLDRAKLLTVSACGYYKFEYKYIYYFYLGRYFAENIDNNRPILYDMINNLDKVENAYIIIFLIHNTKDKDILSHLQISMMCYYDKDKEMTLDSSEIKHIKKWNDTVSDFIFKKNIDPEENRKTLLKQKDYNDDKDEKYDEFDSTLIEMRKALKSIEVMGHILKNRFGSIKTKEFNEYLEFAMNLLFRIGGRLFNQLKEDEKYFVDYFYNELKDNEELINDKEKLLVEIRKLLFRYSLLIVISTIKRCTRTLLSDKLISFMEELNKDNNKRTELTILIEKDAKMTYDKSVNLKKLENYLKDNDKDDFLKNIYKFLIQEYLYFNKISVQEKQKIFSICNFREKK